MRVARLYCQILTRILRKLFRHAPTLRVAADLIAQRAVRRAWAPRSPWTNRKAEADQRQMEKRQATSTNGKAKVDEEQMDKRQTNIDHQSQKQTPKRRPGTENWLQEGRKWHHKRPKIVPRRAEEGAKTIPNRKSNQEAHQDDPKTVRGLGQGPISTTARAPWGPIWAPPNDPKRSLKRSKIQAKIENRKKAIHDDQGRVLERS